MSSSQCMEQTAQVTSISSHYCILPFNWSQWGRDQYADGALHVSKPPVEDLELFMEVTYYLMLQNRIN